MEKIRYCVFHLSRLSGVDDPYTGADISSRVVVACPQELSHQGEKADSLRGPNKGW